MGLGSFFKGLGKVALKAAPIAASFIPGVGPLAGAAISAGTGALSKKASGGNWKDALVSGGFSADTGALGSKVPGLGKGLSPSVMMDGMDSGGITGTMGKEKGGGGFLGGLKKVFTNPAVLAGAGAGVGGLLAGKAMGNKDGNSGQGMQQPMPNYEGTMEGLGPSPLMMRNQNFPNLAEALNAGRQAAYRRYPYGG